MAKVNNNHNKLKIPNNNNNKIDYKTKKIIHTNYQLIVCLLIPSFTDVRNKPL